MLHPEGWSRYGEFGPGGGPVCDSSDIALSPLVISDSSSSAGAGCYGTDFVCTQIINLYTFPRSLPQWGNCTPWSWDWGCGDRQLDPVNCPFGIVLEFLQACFSTGLAHSTLKVHVVAIVAYHAPLGGLSVGKTFPPVLRPEKLMLSGGSGCDPITSSPLISPHLWESRPTHLKVWRPPRPFRYCNAAGWSTHLTFVRFLTKICEPLLALPFSCHSCALHTKQGFASQAA